METTTTTPMPRTPREPPRTYGGFVGLSEHPHQKTYGKGESKNIYTIADRVSSFFCPSGHPKNRRAHTTQNQNRPKEKLLRRKTNLYLIYVYTNVRMQ
mmetsp:Transcript_39283/g.82210  ORF Transcript_39283/g.82210 Transcript_39283/m.82210 type:complete len:98 (-) Transcript_39283:1451-1744(-)